jgi:Fe-S-cluster containining protein
VTAASAFDCRACGACCTSPDENRAEGVAEWVEVRDREPLLRHPQLVASLVVLDDDGARHLRLDGNHRCSALRGRLGHKVRCTIYALRPAACRRVVAGDSRCLQYRAERGIGPSAG